MERETDNLLMKTSFAVMGRILRYIDKEMDSDSFDYEHFTAERFGISRNRFARLISMMIQEGLVAGLSVTDFGERDREDPFGEECERFSIKADNPMLTVKGIRFQAENTVLMKVLNAAKTVGEITGLAGK